MLYKWTVVCSCCKILYLQNGDLLQSEYPSSNITVGYGENHCMELPGSIKIFPNSTTIEGIEYTLIEAEIAFCVMFVEEEFGCQSCVNTTVKCKKHYKLFQFLLNAQHYSLQIVNLLILITSFAKY